MSNAKATRRRFLPPKPILMGGEARDAQSDSRLAHQLMVARDGIKVECQRDPATRSNRPSVRRRKDTISARVTVLSSPNS